MSPPVLSADKLWFGQESSFFQWEMHEYLAELFQEMEKTLSDIQCLTCPDAQAVANLSVKNFGFEFDSQQREKIVKRRLNILKAVDEVWYY